MIKPIYRLKEVSRLASWACAMLGLYAGTLAVGPGIGLCDYALAADTIEKTDKAADDPGHTAPIDPAKKAAIKELIELTKMAESTAAVRDVMLTQVRRSINSILQRSINDDTHISDSQKKQMLDTLSDSSDRIINRYRDLSAERINMTEIMEQVAYKVYDESFTTSELQDLITFYRTPTGQKAMKEMPAIMQRSMILSAQLMQPKLAGLMSEVVSEELARLKGGAAPTGSTSAKPVK